MLQKVPPSSSSGADATRAVLTNPAFQTLVRERSRFAWTLSAVMLVVYIGFILLVAFAHQLMDTTVGAGPTTVGIVLGLAVIVFAFALTGIFVARANTRFDELTRDVTEGRR